MAQPEDPTTASPDEKLEKPPPTSWHQLAAWAAWAIPIVFLLVQLFYMEFIPFFIPFIVVFGLMGLWVLRGGSIAPAVLVILALVFILLNSPFIFPTLAVPASIIDFVSTAWLVLAALTAVIAGVMAFRQQESAEGPRTVQRVVAGLALVALVISVISMATFDDAQQQTGDVRLTAEEIEFNPETPEAGSGTVAVYVTNNDPTYHTFTIDELDVNLDIPAGTSARIEFEADAGTYEFYCVPHEADMQGTLTVQ